MNRLFLKRIKTAPQKKQNAQQLNSLYSVDSENKHEICVLCNTQLNVPRDLNIEHRNYYIQGVGQLCESCYTEINLENKNCSCTLRTVKK